MQMISIKPVGDRSWMVELSGVQNPALFMTGALAETPHGVSPRRSPMQVATHS
jgi:hypothetical protein